MALPIYFLLESLQTAFVGAFESLLTCLNLLNNIIKYVNKTSVYVEFFRISVNFLAIRVKAFIYCPFILKIAVLRISRFFRVCISNLIILKFMLYKIDILVSRSPRLICFSHFFRNFPSKARFPFLTLRETLNFLIIPCHSASPLSSIIVKNNEKFYLYL